LGSKCAGFAQFSTRSQLVIDWSGYYKSLIINKMNQFLCTLDREMRRKEKILTEREIFSGTIPALVVAKAGYVHISV
jgi:hypothetical protein